MDTNKVGSVNLNLSRTAETTPTAVADTNSKAPNSGRVTTTADAFIPAANSGSPTSGAPNSSPVSSESANVEGQKPDDLLRKVNEILAKPKDSNSARVAETPPTTTPPTDADEPNDPFYLSLAPEQRAAVREERAKMKTAHRATPAGTPSEFRTAETANEVLKPAEQKSEVAVPATLNAAPKAPTKKTTAPPRPEDAMSKNVIGGFFLDPSFNPNDPKAMAAARHSYAKGGWYDTHYLINTKGSGIKFHANPIVDYNLQTHFNQPSLDTVPLSEQVPLYSNSGGPFENPVTGLPETVSRRVPARLATEIRQSVTLEVQTHTEFYGLPQIPVLKNIPGLSILADLHRGDLRVNGKVFWITQGDRSGHQVYKVDTYGASFDQQTGDIDGYVNLEGSYNHFEYAYHVRYMLPDQTLRIPGLAWASDKYLGTRPFQMHAEEENPATEGEKHPEPSMLDMAAKALLNPTIGIGGYYERNPPSDANKTTDLIPLGQAYGMHIASKDTGLYAKIGKGSDDSKLYFKDIDDLWLGWAIPTKALYNMLKLKAMSDSMATDMTFFDPMTPRATLDRLFFDEDKFTIAGVFRKYHQPQNPLLGELDPGFSQGPGGPNGDNVRASSQGIVAAVTQSFKNKPFKNKIVNTILGDSRLTLGVQWMNMEIKGNDVDILTPLTSDGGTGSIITKTPASVNPNPAGSWWSASIDFEKNISLGNAGYLKINPYFDYRYVLGEVTDNSYSDAPILTAGFLIGWTPRNAFTRSPLQL